MTKRHFGSISGTVNELQESLQSYLEAQYHIRNLPLIKERRILLETPGIIIQRPYIEATQVYQTGKPYSDLRIPELVKHFLSALAEMEPPVGIYPSPYVHQSNALEEFLGKGNDIIIATGTGSGKTESFLMPLLGKLLIEGHERPDSAIKLGCRAILLYPMNALVNDQLGRIRRLIGDERVSKRLTEARDRIVTFGSYTGRTAYPGQRDYAKDKKYFQTMFEEFYLKHIHNKDKVKELKEMGRCTS
ncbi:DEAD/DEAH box helicase [Planctomycetota bacterium]